MWHRLITLVKKEFQALIANPQSRVLLFMPVLLPLFLFPYAGSLEVKNSIIALYSQDSGAHAIELTQRFTQTEAFPTVHNVYSLGEMQEAIDNQDALLAIIIPEHFSSQVNAQHPAQIQVIADGRRSNAAQIALGYVREIVTIFTKEELTTTHIPQLIVRHEYNPNLEYRWFIVPSLIGIVITIGSMMITSLSIAREKEEGTYEQLLVSPLTPAYIMAGKAIPAIIIAMLQGSFAVCVGIFAYGVPFTGSLSVLILSMFCYSLSLTGFGLLISSICSSQQQAFLASFSFIAPAVVLSGYMAPVENMPTVLYWLSFVNPLRHMMTIAKGIFLKEYDLLLSWPNLWSLLVIALLSTSIASFQLYRKTT